MKVVWLAMASVLLAASLSAQTHNFGPPCTPSEWADAPSISIDRVVVADHHLLPLETGDLDRFHMASDPEVLLAQLLQTAKYRPCILETHVRQVVREFYGWFGYLQTKISVSVSAAGADAVDVTLRIDEGPQYRLHAINFRGTTVFSPDELRSLLPLQSESGQVYDQRHVDRAVSALRLLYSNKGFMNMVPRTEITLDDANRTVDLMIDISEGQFFRMGQLEIVGVADEIRARLIGTWQLREGEPFDESYPEAFFNQNRFFLPPGSDFENSCQFLTDRSTGVVNVRFDFGRPPETQ